jgi:hypothetical protein
MKRYVITAATAEMASNFAILVSISDAEDGSPVAGLKSKNFEVHHLWSGTGYHNVERKVSKVDESPNGFYTLWLEKLKAQPKLFSGHYIFGVIAKKPRPTAGQVGQPATGNVKYHWGQAIVTGDLS